MHGLAACFYGGLAAKLDRQLPFVNLHMCICACLTNQSGLHSTNQLTNLLSLQVATMTVISSVWHRCAFVTVIIYLPLHM